MSSEKQNFIDKLKGEDVLFAEVERMRQRETILAAALAAIIEISRKNGYDDIDKIVQASMEELRVVGDSSKYFHTLEYFGSTRLFDEIVTK